MGYRNETFIQSKEILYLHVTTTFTEAFPREVVLSPIVGFIEFSASQT